MTDHRLIDSNLRTGRGDGSRSNVRREQRVKRKGSRQRRRRLLRHLHLIMRDVREALR